MKQHGEILFESNGPIMDKLDAIIKGGNHIDSMCPVGHTGYLVLWTPPEPTAALPISREPQHSELGIELRRMVNSFKGRIVEVGNTMALREEIWNSFMELFHAFNLNAIKIDIIINEATPECISIIGQDEISKLAIMGALCDTYTAQV